MMVIHAYEALDDYVDFSQYDRDGDGLIDNVFVFYAGLGEASGGADNTVGPIPSTCAVPTTTLRLRRRAARPLRTHQRMGGQPSRRLRHVHPRVLPRRGPARPLRDDLHLVVHARRMERRRLRPLQQQRPHPAALFRLRTLRRGLDDTRPDPVRRTSPFRP